MFKRPPRAAFLPPPKAPPCQPELTAVDEDIPGAAEEITGFGATAVVGCGGAGFFSIGLDNAAGVAVGALLRKEKPPEATPPPGVPPAAVGLADPGEAEMDGAPREKGLVEGCPAAPVPNTKPGFVVPIPAKAEDGAGEAAVAWSGFLTRRYGSRDRGSGAVSGTGIACVRQLKRKGQTERERARERDW